MSLGERISKLRKEKGLTQKELSELSGLSESSIKYYESNTRNPKFHALNEISKVLECNVNDLLENSIKETPKMNTLADYSTEELLQELLRREREN